MGDTPVRPDVQVVQVGRIARIAHEVLRTYAVSLGDVSLPAWSEATREQKQSAVATVETVLENPGASPTELHTLMNDRAEGWVYSDPAVAGSGMKALLAASRGGRVALDPTEELKSALFQTIVREMAGL